jgi:hypothetical protein
LILVDDRRPTIDAFGVDAIPGDQSNGEEGVARIDIASMSAMTL